MPEVMLRHLYHDTWYGRALLAPARCIRDLYRFRLMPEERFLRWRFRQAFGRELDLQNPRTFNEKLQWLKLHDRTPLHTVCADKYTVRTYVADRIGPQYLIPLLYHTRDPYEIRPENLPEPPFIIKTTHGSGGVTIVRDKAAADWERIRRSLRRLLRYNHYYCTKEWQYRHIPPRIIVEPLLAAEAGVVPTDYKFYCFHGKPEVIQVIAGRYVDARECFYSPDWRPLNFRLCYPFLQSPWKRPDHLEQMLDVAARLSADFYHARIDLYDEYGHVFFGEITYHSDSGFSRFDPPEWDRRLGDLLHLPTGLDARTDKDDSRPENVPGPVRPDRDDRRRVDRGLRWS